MLGAGFAGLAVARGLRDAPVDVTVVDANNFHTFQPLLYQVATAGLDADDVSFPVRGIVRGRRGRRSNASVRMGRVIAVDLTRRRVALDDGGDVDYEYLVLATGAVSNDFGVPGVAEHAFPLKHLDDALALRAHVLDRFERAVAGPVVPDGALDVVVCGGGPTGVEMAGGLAELYAKVLAKDFPELPVGRARITLVEMADRLLGPFHPQSSLRALRQLRRQGVEVRFGVGVARADEAGVELSDGTLIPARTIVWATGVAAEPVAAMTGTPTGRGGRLVVEDDLSLPGHPEVFAVGDLALATDVGGSPLPQVAQPAIQGGHHVAAQIRRRLAGQATRPFRYRDKGQMATIGRHAAVAELVIAGRPGGRYGGPIGWLMWLGLHIVYLMGFRNRINVLVNWGWNYVTFDRGSRILRESERRRP